MEEINNLARNPGYWDKVYNDFHKNNKSKRLSMWSNQPSPYLKKTISFFKEKGIKSIMDAGCGDGINILLLAKSGFKEIVGVDYSQVALDNVKKIIHSEGLSKENLKLYNFSLEKIKLPKESIDAIACCEVLAHIKNTQKVLNEFYRLLKPKGYALLEFTSTKDVTAKKGKKIKGNEYSVNGIYFRLHTPEDYRKLIDQKKFKILKEKEISVIHPAHSTEYVRDGKHTHYSHYVLVQKI